MKQTILFAAIVLLTMRGHGQMIKDSLIMDQTYGVDLKGSYKVVTFRKDIYDSLVTAKEGLVREVTINFGTPKKYSIYFRIQFKEEVLDYFLLLKLKK